MRWTRESAVYLTLLLLLQAAYAIGACVTTPFFGFNQLRHLGPAPAFAALGLTWVVGTWTRNRVAPPEKDRSPRGLRLPIAWPLLAIISVAAFLIFRSNSPNPDGVALSEKIPRDVALHGAHVTHDEMLELLLHSRFYLFANRAWGWSVGTSYQVLSALAGGASVAVLSLLARAWAPVRRYQFIALALCGGYVQLFFGDVENYTLVTLMILVYIGLAYRYVRGATPLWAPSFALSAALCLHVLAGWLLPSLVYLFVLESRRTRAAHLAWPVAAVLLPIIALLSYLHFHGLPIQRLFDSSHISAMGGHYGRYIAPLRLQYYGGLANTVALLLPTILMLPALALFGRLGSDAYSRFLQTAAGAMLLFTLVWKARLGVYEDWNLFAPGMIVVALLVARGLIGAGTAPRIDALRRTLILTGGLHSMLWILSNHFRWR